MDDARRRREILTLLERTDLDAVQRTTLEAELKNIRARLADAMKKYREAQKAPKPRGRPRKYTKVAVDSQEPQSAHGKINPGTFDTYAPADIPTGINSGVVVLFEEHRRAGMHGNFAFWTENKMHNAPRYSVAPHGTQAYETRRRLQWNSEIKRREHRASMVEYYKNYPPLPELPSFDDFVPR